MNAKSILVTLILSGVLVAIAGVRPAAAQDYVVVVNQASGVTSLSKKQVSDVFLGRMDAFAGGTKVAPVDQQPDSPIREAFSQGVHGRGVTAVVAFWRQQIFSGKGVPPTEVAGDAEVLKSVAGSPGGIGYVSAGTALPGGVVAVSVSG